MYKLYLCFRYLTTRWIGLASVISVMLGVATLIVVNSVMGGFHTKMRERLKGVLADVLVESTTMDGFPRPDLVIKRIEEVAGDQIEAVAPAIEIFAILHFQNQGRGPHFSRPIRLIGIDPSSRTAVGAFAEFLQNAENAKSPSFALHDDARQWRERHPDLVDPEEPPPVGAIVGYQIASYRLEGAAADQYIIQPGQEIIVTTTTAGRPEPTRARFTVTDIYRCDMSEYDSNYVFVPIEKIQEMRAMGDAVTSLQVRLKPGVDPEAVVARLQAALPGFVYQVQTWEDKQGPLLQAVQIESFLLNVVLSFIVAVAGFGILAIFTMIVMEKTRDIGILKALGASDYGVMGIFVQYGLVLGVIGCIFGVLFGVGFSRNINEVEATITAVTGQAMFPRDIYYFDQIPVLLQPQTICYTVVFALTIAVLASVLPAMRAARLQPVEALRYE